MGNFVGGGWPGRPKRPCYFVMSRVRGDPYPALYWDELPREPVRGREYAVRLDQLPEDSLLRLEVPLSQLGRIYAVLKAAGLLPTEETT